MQGIDDEGIALAQPYLLLVPSNGTIAIELNVREIKRNRRASNLRAGARISFNHASAEMQEREITDRFRAQLAV